MEKETLNGFRGLFEHVKVCVVLTWSFSFFDCRRRSRKKFQKKEGMSSVGMVAGVMW